MHPTSLSLPLLGLLLLISATPPDAASQAIGPGDRVRLHAATPELRPITGTLALGPGDTLILQNASGTLTVSAGSVRVLEVSRGRRRLLWGAAGSAVGALLGHVVASTFAGPEPVNDLDRFRRDLHRIDLTARGMLLGAASGAAIGALLAPEQWQQRPLSAVQQSAGAAPDSASPVHR
jgi:hypothetical protein